MHAMTMDHESHEWTRRGRTNTKAQSSRRGRTFAAFASWCSASTLARRVAEAAIGAALVALPFVTLWAVETTARWMEGRP